MVQFKRKNMAKHDFTRGQNIVLGEIYRRLNYFHKGDLNSSLLLLALPSEVKTIGKYGLIKPTSTETPRAYNWYNLTEKGKMFFANYITKHKLDEDTNTSLFTNAWVKSFDKRYIRE